jgi:pimeloyl-ACP methyl ester carboxylesterase
MIAPFIATALILLGAPRAQAATHDDQNRFESTACPFAQEGWAASLNAECRWLSVSLRRDRVDPERARLFVVILRTQRSGNKPPLVLLHGGPGESALLRMVRGAAQRAPLDRDIVIFDQRGAGLSQPDPCPGFADRVRDLESQEPLGGERREAEQTAARECVARMRGQNLDPASFSTVANAADLLDLRLALGYERWDVYGASYGARLALEAMRRDAGAIRAVILENPQPPGDDGTDAPSNTQHALERVFRACAKSSSCHASFPDPEQTFHAVSDTLRRTPVSAAPAAEGGRSLSLDGAGLGRAVRSLLRSREGISSLPFLLNEMRTGDRLRAARELLRFAGIGRGAPERATFWLVRCNDDFTSAYQARAAAARPTVWPSLGSLGDSLAACPMWQTPTADDGSGAAVRSAIPTLIVTGEFDPRTPTEFGRRLAATLSRSHLYEMPGETHGGGPTGCRAAILSQFMEDPERKLDASCIGIMPPTEFRVKW